MKLPKIAAAMALICLFSACEKTPTEDPIMTTTHETAATTPAVSAPASEPAESAPKPTMFADFREGKRNRYFFASDGWTNGNEFGCFWLGSQAAISDGSLGLTLNRESSGRYISGEYRTNSFYGYGMYEVSMKPIKNIGVVSSFFTYTGPHENGNPWDEIDIEFLGKDTTKIQFNYFTNGVGEHVYLYDLGFDASEDFHTYGFEWAPGRITWYVDGKAVYTARKDIPTTPGRIMMNVWNGVNVDGWLGAYDGAVPLTAEYQWVKFTKAE